MTEKKQWLDANWSKADYMRCEQWDEALHEVKNICELTADQPEFVMMLEPGEHERTVARQVALVVYSNLQQKFQPTDQELIDLTKSQQSHWNFVLLGKLGDRTLLDQEADLYERRKVEQYVTHYFLVKLLHRLKLNGITVNWSAIASALVEGGRWRVMTKPAASDLQERWREDFPNYLPDQDYPSPWKIANRYQAGPFTRHEGIYEFMPCRVQNDGIIFIPRSGFQNDGLIRDRWVLNGVKPPEEGDGQAQQADIAYLLDRIERANKRIAQLEMEQLDDLERIKDLEEELYEAHLDIDVLKAKLDQPIRLQLEINPLTGKIKKTG